MKDLSSMLKPETALTSGLSMSAGNTVSPNAHATAMGAPGSEPVNPPPKIGYAEDTPGMDIPPVHDYAKKVK